jgi:hypothetical protein
VGAAQAVAIIGLVNAPRTHLSKMPESHSLVLDGRTWAEVSLAALRENFHAVQKHVGNDVTICAVVKADGYGHGAVECALALESEGARWLGVTDAAEGLALRGAGVMARILLMTGIWKGEEDGIVTQNLTPTIWEPWHVETLERSAGKRQSNLPVRIAGSVAAFVRDVSSVQAPDSRRSEHALCFGGGVGRRRRGTADEVL